MRSAHTVAEEAAEMERMLASIRRRMRAPLEKEFAQVTGPQRIVMRQLVAASGALTLSELTQRVGLAQSTVSGIVGRLEAQGLIRRRRNPQDSRSALLEPGKAVQKFLAEKAPQLTISPLVAALKRMKSAQREALLESLRELEKKLNECP